MVLLSLPSDRASPSMRDDTSADLLENEPVMLRNCCWYLKVCFSGCVRCL